MASILTYYSDNRRKITKVVDQTLQALIEDDSSIFGRIAPIVNYPDVMFLIIKLIRSKPTIASLVGDESELPQSRSRMTLTEETLSEARLGKQYIFKNNDFKAYQRFLDAARNVNRPDIAQQYEKLFLGLAADLVPAVVEKMTVLLMDVLLKGTCNFVDPLTEVRFVLNYPDVVTSGVNQLVFTSNPAAGDSWDNVAANGLAQIDAHSTAYNNVHGIFPPAMGIRWSLLRSLANQTSSKLAKSQNNGYGIASTDTTSLNAIYVKDEEMIDLILERMRGGSVELIGAQYAEESETGSTVEKYFLPDDSYFFFSDNMGERAIVPTPEKNFDPGIYVNAKQINDAPRVERIATVASGIPAIMDSKKIAARKVKIS